MLNSDEHDVIVSQVRVIMLCVPGEAIVRRGSLREADPQCCQIDSGLPVSICSGQRETRAESVICTREESNNLSVIPTGRSVPDVWHTPECMLQCRCFSDQDPPNR